MSQFLAPNNQMTPTLLRKHEVQHDLSRVAATPIVGQTDPGVRSDESQSRSASHLMNQTKDHHIRNKSMHTGSTF